MASTPERVSFYLLPGADVRFSAMQTFLFPGGLFRDLVNRSRPPGWRNTEAKRLVGFIALCHPVFLQYLIARDYSFEAPEIGAMHNRNKWD